MAINKQNLKERSTTAFFFVLIMVASFLISDYTFFAILSIILIVGILEWKKIYTKICERQQKKNILFFISILLGYIVIPIFIYAFLAQGSLLKIATPNWRFDKLLLPCFILLSMWINDTMAYLVGSLIGKTPLSKISPKKTWEGTIGGIILCSIFVGYLGYKWDNHLLYNLSLISWIFLGLSAAIAGTFGDLLESKLKRMAGVKDSGTFMPGHGGILDRFDSLLLAIPITSFVFLILLQ